MIWYITTQGDQQAWQDFCEEFMSEDIQITRHYRNNVIVVTCQITLNPYQPIDSTGSMPSFVNLAEFAGFVLKVTAESTTREHTRF